MVEWITEFLERSGYLGVLLLMFLENIFPPIPSELIMPFSGFAAARGDLNLIGVIAAGTAGSLLGALPWYWAGRVFGLERLKRLAQKHGQWLTMSSDDVDKANDWFKSHCGKAVFLGRLVPAVRTLISVPAGISEMSLPRFLLYSASGTVLWNSPLAAAGYALGARYEEVAKYLDPLTKGVLALLVLAYIYRVWRMRRNKRHRS